MTRIELPRRSCTTQRLPRLPCAALALTTLTTLAPIGCGSNTSTHNSTAGAAAAVQPASPRCARAVALGVGQVAEHIYREFAEGRVVEPAVRRLQRSAALIAAAQSGDPAAAKAALLPLIHGQLARVRVVVAGRTLAEYGSAEALAPVTAPLRDSAGRTIGTLVASQQGTRGYVDTVATFVSAHVLVRASSRQLAGTTLQAPSVLPAGGEAAFGGRRYSVRSFSGSRFPSGALRVYVLAPVPPPSMCARTTTATFADAIGASAVSIYRDEQSGSRAQAVVRDFERSRSFQRAVASGDTPATEAAIVAFFKTRLHVVRVRATLAGRLVADVGGPHVLAPIAGSVRDAQGHLVGHFALSVQDDLGYLILAHRFTGAQVLLRQGTTQVMGNLSPGPAHVPDRGVVVYRGVRYQAYSFLAEAFPSGPLRVSLLIPPVPAT